MMYMVDYIRESDMAEVRRFVKATDETEAFKAVVDEFFDKHPGDRIAPRGITCVEFTGDLTNIEEIENALIAH